MNQHAYCYAYTCFTSRMKFSCLLIFYGVLKCRDSWGLLIQRKKLIR